MISSPTSQPEAALISFMQSEAWAAWNDSYHVPDGETYRALGRELYRQDVHERIAAMFARLDEQNAQLDAITSESR
jgi:squalene cyclase